MSEERKIVDRVPPRLQKDWDIRGALNFILGGAGGGLLAMSAPAAGIGLDLRPLLLLGLALIAGGLFAVWLKIGRPWRAMFVVRRPSTSWMSREAWLAPVVFGCGAAALLLRSEIATYILGLLGLVFAYAQGRILKANIGIPAWRRWSCVALVVVTALAEGAGLLCLASLLLPPLLPYGYALAILLLVRFLAWRRYRGDLAATGAPTAALAALDAVRFRFEMVGHAAAGALALVGAFAGQPTLVAAGGALAVGAGAMFKYTLVCRAAFTQGFALPFTPSRGRSKPGAGAQPGWQAPRG
jgi:phenylacetyl-CoA:acceptor oxidoreductase 26-kDa subunit